MIRELKKYASMRSLDRLPVRQVAAYLACKLHLGAFDPRREFSGYVAMYNKALDSELKKKARIMNQASIIEYILDKRG